MNDHIINKLYQHQEGKCACCSNRSMHLLVDRDADGLIRGLICSDCSKLLAAFPHTGDHAGGLEVHRW